MITELGIMIRILRIQKDNITQDKLAAELSCSPATLSNIMNGKIDPDIPFLVKCKKYFKLNDKDTIELFTKAFASSKSITVDTSYLIKERKNQLIGIIVSLLFIPEQKYSEKRYTVLNEAIKCITESIHAFEKLEELG
ncbi:MAG: helix-turn-helix domain-containing protein [Spirochaetaceae bacterium]|jgi:transcriptional regulator with XRE-family HTH domain|nr:helix-turn-helix domain-containing protein [Spirochaetaceae bacterium]